MTPQERQMLADLFERIRSAAGDPRDAEAEAFIAEAVRAQPYAPYVLAQTALVQQHALDAAAQRIQELEARAAQPAAGDQLPRQSRPLPVRRRPADRRDPAMTRAPISAPPRRRLAAGRSRLRPAARRPVGRGARRIGRRLPRQRDDHRDRRRRRPVARRMRSRACSAAAAAACSAAGHGGGFGGGETIVNNYYDAPADAGVDTAAADPGADPGFQDANDFSDGGFDDDGSAAAASTSSAPPRAAKRARSDDDDLRADPNAVVEVDHVLVHHPDAAGRNVAADRLGSLVP